MKNALWLLLSICISEVLLGLVNCRKLVQHYHITLLHQEVCWKGTADRFQGSGVRPGCHLHSGQSQFYQLCIVPATLPG